MQKPLNIRGFAFLLGSILFQVHLEYAIGHASHVVTTDKEYITLADIFPALPHTDARSKVEILDAPAYGQHIILDKQKLLNIHKKYKLGRSIPIPWTFKILRKGRLLKQEEIEYIIDKKVKEEYGSKKYQLSIFPKKIWVPENISLQGLTCPYLILKDNNTFEAELSYIGQGNKPEVITIKGQAIPLKRIPVLKRNKKQGELIEQNDLTFAQVPSKKLQSSVFKEEAELIGKKLKRSLNKNTPIRATDLVREYAVQKGSLVTAVSTYPHMQLSLKTHALESKKIGEVVQLEGHDKKRKITGVVKGPGYVYIQ